VVYSWAPKHRRSKVQIMEEILQTSYMQEVGKTQISASVNIGSQQIQKYLQNLLELRLLDIKVKGKNKVSFQTTQRGEILLKQLDSVKNLLKETTSPSS
jgi:predicted transcriptional regulator